MRLVLGWVGKREMERGLASLEMKLELLLLLLTVRKELRTKYLPFHDDT